MNKKMLTAQQNRWYAWQGRAATNLYADKAQAYHDSLTSYTNKFNSLLGRKVEPYDVCNSRLDSNLPGSASYC